MTIQANELRIGNYIYLPDQIKHEIKEGSELDAIKLYDGRDYYKGIPLTEEWLLKFGFETKSRYAVGVGSYYTYDFGKLSLLKNLKGEFYFPALPFSTIIHSVHQLQNLYFSLVGSELVLSTVPCAIASEQ